jgi:hypothetical protein
MTLEQRIAAIARTIFLPEFSLRIGYPSQHTRAEPEDDNRWS